MMETFRYMPSGSGEYYDVDQGDDPRIIELALLFNTSLVGHLP